MIKILEIGQHFLFDDISKIHFPKGKLNKINIKKWQGELGPPKNPMPSSHHRKVANITKDYNKKGGMFGADPFWIKMKKKLGKDWKILMTDGSQNKRQLSIIFILSITVSQNLSVPVIFFLDFISLP